MPVNTRCVAVLAGTALLGIGLDHRLIALHPESRAVAWPDDPALDRSRGNPGGTNRQADTRRHSRCARRGLNPDRASQGTDAAPHLLGPCSTGGDLSGRSKRQRWLRHHARVRGHSGPGVRARRIGQSLLTAVKSGDLMVIMGTALVAVILISLVNLITDICQALLDPRVKLT